MSDAGPAERTGELTPALLDSDVWSEQLLVRAGIPIVDWPLVSIGGGLGSFTMIDHLRICGVRSESLRVLTPLTTPWESFGYLTRVSQISQADRLRSDSSSCPDNIWGFPSYAVREALGADTVSGFFTPLWQVLTEPVLAEPYTPRLGQVIDALTREHARIRYPEMVVNGQVRMVRRRADGGYFTILTSAQGSTAAKRIAFRSGYVHLAVGHAGLTFLPDLQRYRESARNTSRVVNAYQPHEHVYDQLRRRPGTVIVRGSGIVASRVLQRLIDERNSHGLQTRVVHILSGYIAGPHGPWFARRCGGDGFAYQAFDDPKAVWGGQLRDRARRTEGPERVAFYESVGGSSVPYRRGWQDKLATARTEGWYSVVDGQVDALEPGTDDLVGARVRTGSNVLTVEASFVIDCTGLESDIGEQRILADLLQHSGAGRNPLGRLDVEPTFEVRGTRSGKGRLYASGAATHGGYLPGVDTFAGLQIAAAEIADDLAAVGFCRRLGAVGSFRQWLRWATNTVI
ncbi:MAG: hypothetical protein M3313_01290 [Actinomycetota bacterium]|nr:hypothetical protein [Actinomycetota bacterium]